MKATAYTVLIWLFLVFVAGQSLNLYFEAKADNTRLLYDLKTALETAVQYKTRDGHQASKITAQEVTISELKKAFPEVVLSLKNLYIPPRRAESYTQASQTLKAEITAPVRDSFVIRTITDTIQVRVMNFADEWISIHAALGTDTGKIKVAAVDTIFTAVYRGERRRPWLWILSRRNYEAAATNRSPYVKIDVIKAGIIKK